MIKNVTTTKKIPVLLIEDNEDLRETIKNELGLNGFNVYTAVDGPSGRKAACDYKLHLILLDVTDGMDDIVSALKLDARTSHIPVIILTEGNSAAANDLASEICADGYITKPFDEKNFAEIVKLKLENCEAVMSKAQDQNAPSVLVIDDDGATRRAIQHNLYSNGFKVYMAPNGLCGIKAAREYKPDLILLDVIMPEMDGLEVLVNLKWNKKTKDIPVLMLTSKKTIGDIETAYARNADGYLTKPFTGSELVNTVKRNLGI
ncbi:MAG: response regulator [Planctomycetota bacterium]|jgi:DNA-binding response OmpR family regulator